MAIAILTGFKTLILHEHGLPRGSRSLTFPARELRKRRAGCEPERNAK
ncbi:MAG: hypothetical protein LAP85_02085 [Acidobacteriia bacterium]|nr:hypothetical protein [Terriglobia bacterium]